MMLVLDAPKSVRKFNMDLFYPAAVVDSFFDDLAFAKQDVGYWQRAYTRNDPVRVLLSEVEIQNLKQRPIMAKLMTFIEDYETKRHPKSVGVEQALSLYNDFFMG